MACTVVVTLSDATVSRGTRVYAECVITNGGASSVNVLDVTPTMTPTGVGSGAVPGVFETVYVNPDDRDIDGSSGTRTYVFSCVAFAPQTTVPTNYVYDVGVDVRCSDGSLATHSTTLTVTSA